MENLPEESIDKFLVPNYSREELNSGPRIAVRFGARELSLEQGPDERDVVIEVGVIGVTPAREALTEADYRAAQVAACDGFDGLMESVVALWTPDGPLEFAGMADHSFAGISQSINFDPQKLYDESIWLSVIQLTYRDTFDD